MAKSLTKQLAEAKDFIETQRREIHRVMGAKAIADANTRQLTQEVATLKNQRDKLEKQLADEKARRQGVLDVVQMLIQQGGQMDENGFPRTTSYEDMLARGRTYFDRY